MIKQIFSIAFPQIAVLLVIIGTMTVRDYSKFVLGTDETNLLSIAFVVYGLIISLFYFVKPYSKHVLSVFIFFIILIIFIIGFSSLPSQRLERAKQHYQRFDSDSLSVKHDKYYSATIDYIRREQKARQLELEVAELRYYGPKEFYGGQPLNYILFFSGIGLMIALGIWTIYRFNDDHTIKVSIPLLSGGKSQRGEQNKSEEKKFNSDYNTLRSQAISLKSSLLKWYFGLIENKNPRSNLENLKMLPTQTTPEVFLDKEGIFEIKGPMIPNDAFHFFQPIDLWINKYISNPVDITSVIINLEIINADSKKYLLLILQKISHITISHKNLIINWYYDDSDSDILEIGEQLSSYLGISFTFIRSNI